MESLLSIGLHMMVLLNGEGAEEKVVAFPGWNLGKLGKSAPPHPDLSRLLASSPF
jgi:hypothetical protein